MMATGRMTESTAGVKAMHQKASSLFLLFQKSSKIASTDDAIGLRKSYSLQVDHACRQPSVLQLRNILPAGNVRLANGDRYTGDFLKGHPHGHGRSVTSGGDKYTGDWREGQRHGKGKCVFANGDRYQGQCSPSFSSLMAHFQLSWRLLNYF